MMDAYEFRDRVLEQARERYPEVAFEEVEGDAELLMVKGTQVGLRNLRARFEQSDGSEEALEGLVGQHLQLVVEGVPEMEPFAAAKAKLRPQIMPLEYTQKAPLVSMPLGRTLAIGIVIDRETAYQYLLQKDAEGWGKTPRELLDAAIENLEEASDGLQMQSALGDEVKSIIVSTRDSFDAARILMPGFRGFLVENLGAPFCFAIPNRDFLICWNTDAQPQIAAALAARVRQDFGEQPYPLSPNVFVVMRDGAIVEEGEAG